MCIGAVDFLGDAMNCKGSVFSTIVCSESSWCDGRDEDVVTSKSSAQRSCDEDISGRYGDLLDTQSLSSSVHHLLHDSSQRRRRRPATTAAISNVNIFRSKATDEDSNGCAAFGQLNRCTAWVQEDYSVDSEYPSEDLEKRSDTRIIHWEDRLANLESLNAKHGCDIFRRNNSFSHSNNNCSGVFKLQRCTAWSLDDSSLVVKNVRRESPEISAEAKAVHWDEIVQGSIN
eukprot:jgi/Psemu1/303386/fgenesh1_kg.103_\